MKLVDGMEANGILSDETGHILTGYIGSESFLRAVVTVVRKMKADNQHIRYVCDPVLGDIGRFYVPEQLVKIYKEEVIPIANVLTPNQFEVEQLTGVKIENSVDQARRACSILHDIMGTLNSMVLITSIVFSENEDSLGIFASTRHPGSSEGGPAYEDEQLIVYIPKLPGQFTGTGDICAALWLALTADMDEMQNKNNESSLKQKLEQLAGTMNAIVQRTHLSSVTKLQKEGISSLDAKDEATKKKIVRSREMKLIQSANDILNPPSTRFQAVRVSER